MKNENNEKKNDYFTLGIVGGMGPLVSAAFVDTLYKEQAKIVKLEQDYLRLVSLSYPSIPDRTQYLVRGQEVILLNFLTQQIKQLLTMGCNEIVILCITLHTVLPRLAIRHQRKLKNLITVALSKLIELQQPIVLLASLGTYQFSIFEKNSLWPKIREWLIKPTEKDQELIHEMAYQLKFLKNKEMICKQINELVTKYHAAGWLAGCTEFSLINQLFVSKYPNVIVIDPLMLLIQHYAKLPHV